MSNGDGDGGLSFVTYKECQSNINHMKSDLTSIKDSVKGNSDTNNRILKILQGNGEGGLIWKVNSMLLRNQWLDRACSGVISVFLTLLTLYLTGVLRL